MSNLADIPTPSPVPSPTQSPYSLSERINIATRPVHSQLNRLILARLPLALPPYTDNPSTYISGLLHIAPIYITFESLWNSIIHAPQLPTSLTKTLDVCDPLHPIVDARSPPAIPGDGIPKLVHTPKVCSRTHALLSHLRLPGLLRSGRLRADIRVLTGTPEHEIDGHLEAVSQNGKLLDFIAHTTQSVEANPHVLLAYAWVLYMALFSGGRYLRASLKEAGGSQEFWTRDPSPVRPYIITQKSTPSRRSSRTGITSPMTSPSRPSRSRTRSESPNTKLLPGLQFFNFVSSSDGEDIKLEFKKRITEAEILLTDGEKEDIILEAQSIFVFMVEMVHELDRVMGTNEDDLDTARLAKTSALKGTRDSVFVTKERLLTKRSSTSSSSDEHEGLQKRRKQSQLQVLFTSPIAKVVRFNEGLQESIVIPLARTFSDKLSPRISISEQGDPKKYSEGLDLVLRGTITMFPLLALLVAFMAWYWVS